MFLLVFYFVTTNLHLYVAKQIYWLSLQQNTWTNDKQFFELPHNLLNASINLFAYEAQQLKYENQLLTIFKFNYRNTKDKKRNKIFKYLLNSKHLRHCALGKCQVQFYSKIKKF